MIHQALAWNGGAPPIRSTTRKQVLQQLIGGASGWMVLGASSSVAEAAPPKVPPKYLLERGSEETPLSPCNGQPIKKSCWSTEDTGGRRLEQWVPPADLHLQGAEAIVRDLEATIGTYPQAGQSGVDKGGWKLAQRGATSSDDGRASTYYLRYEYTSGRFHYVDDLEIRVDGANGKVCTRSVSREGGFDYNVNKTRLNYLASLLAKRGWNVQTIL
jgi:hypothetical protein